MYSSDFGVPQLRPRFVLVALRKDIKSSFVFPSANAEKVSVADTIFDLMNANGWIGASLWKARANNIAPTIVGGSKKHGGADLGPTRAKREWLELGVDGKGIANGPPSADDAIDHVPRLTLNMVARLQGFPDDWKFYGGKTSIYRQIGNAFPPPVAKAIGQQILRAISGEIISNPDKQIEIDFAA